MKTALRFLLILISTIAAACFATSAAESTVYLGETGNDANTGTSISDSVATLSRAYELLDDSGGTIYVSGAVIVDSNAKNGSLNVFEEPVHSGKIRLTSADADAPATLKFESTTHWYLSGETEIDNIQIKLTANGVWAARHNHFTVGNNVTMLDSGTYYIILLGGCNAGGEIVHATANTYLTFYSGTFGYIYGGNRNTVSEACRNGSVKIEVFGDIACTGAFSPGSVSQNVHDATVVLDGTVTTGTHFYFGGFNQKTGTVEQVTFLLKSGKVNCGGTFAGGINRVKSVSVYYAETASDLRTNFAEYLTAPIESYCTEVIGGHTYDKNNCCSICGIHTHRYDDGVITTPATCTTPGFKTYTCMNCSQTPAHSYTEPIDALDHDMAEREAEVPATCETPGKTAVLACQRQGCTHTEGGEVIDALDHDLIETAPAEGESCTSPGKTAVLSCQRPGCTYTEGGDIVGVLGHDLVEIEAAVPATCTEPGKTAVMACQRANCDHTEGGEVIPAPGHSWSDWVETIPAQPGVAGEERKTCTVCEAFETRALSPLPEPEPEGNRNLIALVVGMNKGEYTVRFNTVGASKIEPQTVKKGKTVAEPEEPVKAGFYFAGWYRDARYQEKYDFAEPVREDLTLYAKWDTVDPRIVMTIGSTDVHVFGMATVSDVPPVIVKDRTMLPARFVLEALGATVSWNASERKVTILYGEKGIELYIDSTTAYMDGTAAALDAAPFIREDRTYLPLRFIAEALGADVNWMAQTKTIVIRK